MTEKEGIVSASEWSNVCRFVAMLAVLLLLRSVWRGTGAEYRMRWIRESLAEQGCTLILEDDGAGETWRVICEEAGL